MSPRRQRKRSRRTGRIAARMDLHALYEAAVQDPDTAVPFLQRLHRKHSGRAARILREDFCGTAALSCAWVRQHRDNRAWGVDLDADTLQWGREHNIALLGRRRRHISLFQSDVRRANTPAADIVGAFNFSYCVFKERTALLAYLRAAFHALKPGGLFVCDLFGGKNAMDATEERKTVPAHTRPDGLRVPRFTYIWEHECFNVVDHSILCHIHFRFRDGSRIRKAFTYDWRLWTLPEMRELLYQAGFRQVDTYIHGWTPDGESNEIYRRRSRYENADGWLSFITALK